MLVSSWKQVKPETIQSCFKRAGFRSKSTADPIEVKAVETVDISSKWWLLQQRHGVSSVVSFDDFIHFDDSLATSATMTDEAIVKMVIDQNSDEPPEEIDTDVESSEPDESTEKLWIALKPICKVSVVTQNPSWIPGSDNWVFGRSITSFLLYYLFWNSTRVC